MKCSLVLFSYCAHLPLYSRPELVDRVEHELHGDDKLHEEKNSTDAGINPCDFPQAKDTVKNRCKLPGHHFKDQVLVRIGGQCTGRGRWRVCAPHKDFHPWCRIGCCDPGRQTPHEKCECTPYKEPYNYAGHWGGHVHGANSAEKCCGRNKDGRPTVWDKDHSKCGCTEVGVNFIYGGHGDRDCCSKHHDGNKCIKAPCKKKGESGKCCRVASDSDDRSHKDKCPCFHAGQRPNPNDEVSHENCCSGGAAPDGTCGCIENAALELPFGADKNDCCSGVLTEDGKHCLASKCTHAGETAAGGGDHCCSDKKKDGGGKCPCLDSGVDLPDGATAVDCCSHRAKDGKCDYLKAGELVPNISNPERACLSSAVYAVYNEDGEKEVMCSCIAAGKTSTDATQCCSGVADGGKCTCVGVGGLLEHGGADTTCCSGFASPEGICRCAPPGAPLPNGDPSMCCTGKAGVGGKVCGCFYPRDVDNTTALDSQDGFHCCGGFYQYSDEEGCACLRAGTGIGSWVSKSACCSNTTEGANCK